jgi:hypothetical protein
VKLEPRLRQLHREIKAVKDDKSKNGLLREFLVVRLRRSSRLQGALRPPRRVSRRTLRAAAAEALRSAAGLPQLPVLLSGRCGDGALYLAREGREREGELLVVFSF